VLMSGYLGSIGFAFPARDGRGRDQGHRTTVVSVSGEAGFSASTSPEMNTAVGHRDADHACG